MHRDSRKAAQQGFPDLERLAAALGPAARVAYAPPNIYPMSAPSFTESHKVRPKSSASGALGVYVHVPFCNYHCNFCFYETRVGTPEAQRERYVRAVQRELEWIDRGAQLTQLYVGGGTPTTLTPALLDELLASVFARVVDPGTHIHTVECSPESVEPEHLRVLRSHNIGRLSMGIQSLYADVLDTIRRRHDAQRALEACEMLVGAGLVLNVDLIYGLPGQTEESFRRDFEAAVRHGVHSITAYNLRVNERTPVARVIDETERLELGRLVRWRWLVKRAADDLGFTQTRWHTFRRGDGGSEALARAQRFEDVTGRGDQFGAGLSARSRFGSTIYRNEKKFAGYMQTVEQGGNPVAEVFPLSETGRRIRFIGLTLGDGARLDRKEYLETFGASLDEEFPEPLARMRGNGLIEDDGRYVELSEDGKLVYDLVTLAFYPEDVRRWIHDRQATIQGHA